MRPQKVDLILKADLRHSWNLFHGFSNLAEGGMFNPMDTGRKLNVYKTFRVRPRRLLNVLCTLYLRPVSRDGETDNHENFLFDVLSQLSCCRYCVSHLLSQSFMNYPHCFVCLESKLMKFVSGQYKYKLETYMVFCTP